MTSVFLITLFVGIGTYLIRGTSLSLGSRVSWPLWLRDWLSYVTPAVLGALLGPTLFLDGTRLIPIHENAELIPACIAAIVAWWSRHLLWTVVTGIVAFAIVSAFI
jgi:branched-subunit amino acid transport protein